MFCVDDCILQYGFNPRLANFHDGRIHLTRFIIEVNEIAILAPPCAVMPKPVFVDGDQMCRGFLADKVIILKLTNQVEVHDCGH